MGKIKKRFKEIQENAKELDNSDLGVYFMVCFSVGTVLFYAEMWWCWIPEWYLWVVPFILGCIFLFPLLIFDYDF